MEFNKGKGLNRRKVLENKASPAFMILEERRQMIAGDKPRTKPRD